MKKFVLTFAIFGMLLGFLYPIQVSASVNKENTETKKVEVGKDVVIANTSKYVDRDHALDCFISFTVRNVTLQSFAPAFSVASATICA